MIGRALYQPLFQAMHQLSLQGMNIGGGTNVRSSGESVVIERILPGLIGDEHPTVFDVGANVGTYSEEIYNSFRGDVLLHAFEPSPTAYAQLSARMGGRPGVHLHAVGLGARDEPLTLYANEPGSGLSSVYHRRLDHLAIPMDETEGSVSAARRCLRGGGVPGLPAKMDVEGHELGPGCGASRCCSGVSTGDPVRVRWLQHH
jgi:FkbM family methyltransferase